MIRPSFISPSERTSWQTLFNSFVVIPGFAVSTILRFAATLINARFAKPFDGEVIKSLTAYHHTIVTMEENVKSAGFGEHVAEYLEDNGIDLKLINISIPDAYVEHGNVDKLKEMLKIDALSVADRIINEVL